MRSIAAINNSFLVVQLCCCSLGSIIAGKGKLYETCMEAWEGFGDDPEGVPDRQRYGKATLRLYRVKRGIQSILAHTEGRPEIRKRAKRPKPDQLTLF